LRNRLSEVEGQLSRTILENEKLRQQCEILGHENEGWKQRYNSLEKQRTTDLENLRQGMELERKATLDRELKNQEIKLSMEKNAAESKVKEYRQKIVELEQKNQFFTVELERLTKLLDERMRELESWKARFAELEHNKSIEVEEVRIQFDSMRRSQIGINDHSVRFAAERSAFETQIMQLRQKLCEFELRITDLTKENQRFNQLYAEKQKEVEMITQRSSSDKGGYSYEVEELRRELDNYRRNSDTKEIKVKYEMERSAMENQLIQLRQVTEANKVEMQKLLDLSNSRKAENDVLARQLSDARNEINRLVKDFKAMEAEFMTKNSKFEGLFREAEELARSRDMYKSQLENNNNEITKKNKELIEKIRELDGLKNKYEEALANMEPLSMTGSRIITRTYLDKK